jgi:hypothetical protein
VKAGQIIFSRMLYFCCQKADTLNTSNEKRTGESAMKVEIVILSRDGSREVGRLSGEKVGTTPTGLVRVRLDDTGKIKAVSARSAVEVAE